MRCTPELLEIIKDAIESISYGSVEITLHESGAFVEIIKRDKVRYDKQDMRTQK